MKRARALGAAALLALAGCATESPQPAAAEPQVPSIDSAVDDLAGDSVIEVQPLAAPGVSLLLQRARAAEAAGEIAEAERLLQEALALAPRDPEAWQRLAELSLLAGEWSMALYQARESFHFGPKIGRLCARNWLTISRAYRARGEEARADHAEGEATDCAVRARERL